MAQLSQEVSFIIIISVFLLLMAVGIIALVLVYRRKQVEYVHEQTRLKTAFEKELLEARLEVREQTMRHIAQELHDNIGGTLSLARLTLASVNLTKPDAVAEKVADSKQMVTKAIGTVRTLSKTLHGEAVLAAGLAATIKMELDMIRKTGVFEASLTLTGPPVDINAQKELILFRTVQEALNNAIKHSEATEINVAIHYQPDVVQVTITDNGKGFGADVQPPAARGSGMRNMRNRTELIGGELIVVTTSGGTQLRITLPTTDP